MTPWRPRIGIRVGIAGACLALAALEPAEAGTPDRVSIFLRSNHIHLRIPAGPEYQAVVNSPVYESYAKEHATECARPPIIAGRDEIGVYYKTSKGPQTGVVRIEALVDPTGHVAAIQVIESPGGYALYSVIKAVRDWTFVPGETGDGKPTYCRYEYGFRFVSADG